MADNYRYRIWELVGVQEHAADKYGWEVAQGNVIIEKGTSLSEHLARESARARIEEDQNIQSTTENRNNAPWVDV